MNVKILDNQEIYSNRRFGDDEFVLTIDGNLYHIKYTITPILENKSNYTTAIYVALLNNIITLALTAEEIFSFKECIEGQDYDAVFKKFMCIYTTYIMEQSEKMHQIDAEITLLEKEIYLLENHIKYAPDGDGYQEAKKSFTIAVKDHQVFTKDN